MKFMKNLLRRLTTVVVGFSIAALLVVSYANAVQAGTMGDDGNVGISSDISGIKRNQEQVSETNRLDPNSDVDEQFYQQRNMKDSNGQFPRDRDTRAYDKDASLGVKFSDTLENAKKTFEEATKSVSEQQS